MSIAKKCNRCGTYYDEYNVKDSSSKINGFMTLNLDSKQSYHKNGPYDLCPSCSSELMEWFIKYRKENK